ncbi:hypothetical protein TrRE_jg647, partial [Triparma retinervis]
MEGGGATSPSSVASEDIAVRDPTGETGGAARSGFETPRSDADRSSLYRVDEAASERPSTVQSSVQVSEAETTPERKQPIVLNPKSKKKSGAMGDFVKWGKRKNNSVAPTTSIPPASTGDTAGGDHNNNNSALNTANNSEISDDSDADSVEGESRRVNRVNEMFDSLEADLPSVEAEESNLNMDIKSVPYDGQLARQLIFAHRDRIDKIKEVVFNVSMVLLVLFIYLILNSFVFREIISNLYSINHKTWSTSATLEVHEGVFGVVEGGKVLVNVDETNAKYPLEIKNKVAGGDSVLRINSFDPSSSATNTRTGLILGNQDLDQYDVQQGGQIMTDWKGNMDVNTNGNISINSASGHILLGSEVMNSNIGLGTKTPQHKLDIFGDARVTGTFILKENENGVNSSISVDSKGLSLSSDLIVNGMLKKGSIGEDFGDILIPKRKIEARTATINETLTTKTLTVNDDLTTKTLKVTDSIDLTGTNIYVNQTLNEASNSIGNVQVANLNVTTLWFKTMHMQQASSVQYGCVDIDPTQMEVSGEFKQSGISTFSNDVSMKDQELDVTNTDFKGEFKVTGGADFAAQTLKMGGATLSGGFTVGGVTTFGSAVSLAGQIVTVGGGAIIKGGLSFDGTTTFASGTINAQGRTLNLDGSTLNGGFTIGGLTTFTNAVDLSAQTVTVTGGTLKGDLTVNGLMTFVNGINLDGQTVDMAGTSTLFGGFTTTGVVSFTSGKISLASQTVTLGGTALKGTSTFSGGATTFSDTVSVAGQTVTLGSTAFKGTSTFSA